MDEDRIKGSAEQARGKVKEVAGKLTGAASLKAKARPTKWLARFRTPSAASRIRCAASSNKKARLTKPHFEFGGLLATMFIKPYSARSPLTQSGQRLSPYVRGALDLDQDADASVRADMRLLAR